MQAVEIGTKSKHLSLIGNRFHPSDHRMYCYVTVEYEHPRLTFRAHHPQWYNDHSLPEKVEKRIDDLARLAISIRLGTPYASDEVEVMLDEPRGWGMQYSGTNTCGVSVYSPDYLEVFTHEFGHITFRKADSLAWRLIYLFSLGGLRRFDIVKDAQYSNGWQEDLKGPLRGAPISGEPISWDHQNAPGHPWANADELFASAFNAFVLHSQILVDKIQAEDTAPDMSRLGVLIYLYLRDEVFLGQTFLDKDPLSDSRLDQSLSELGVQEIVEALESPHPETAKLLEAENRFRGDLKKIMGWLDSFKSISVTRLCNRIGWRSFPSFILAS